LKLRLGAQNMAVVESLMFQDSKGATKNIAFVASEFRPTKGNFEATLITGQNGSHKSTLLRELVAALTLTESESKVTLRDGHEEPHHVLCMSGAVADRFPTKELPAGVRSRFDVPAYAYIGQRAGPNLLSKKAPLETMLRFALDPTKAERFASNFFHRAHQIVGIVPSVEFIFQRRQSKLEGSRDLIGRIKAKTPQTDTQRRPPGSPKGSNAPHISFATASWLLDEFTYDEFLGLEQQINASGRRLKATLTSSGIRCDDCSPNVLRLGLITGLIGLVDANVEPLHDTDPFSIFELSSGEYHMYSTILGLGFGITESSVVLIDEPENSLHPQWQRELMEAVFEICEETLRNGHLIVCTHSPLIVGTAKDGSSVVDLSSTEPRLSKVRFGASSDELLLSQFGVGSSRNRIVVDIVQRAVSLVERGDFGNNEFASLIPELKGIRRSLSRSDPLMDVIDALIEGDAEE
jgi:predicted ATPase